MKKENKLIIILLCTIAGVAVLSIWITRPAEGESGTSVVNLMGVLPYDILHPDTIITLPPELTEVSGISYYRDNILACIEDENGIIYLLDYESGEMKGNHKFGKDKDYEDIEIMKDTIDDMETKIYILLNTGTIYRIKNLGLADQKIKKYQTFLSSRDDAEGLCYHRGLNALLITCKNPQYLAGMDEPIYTFDLNKKSMTAVPLFSIDIDAIREKAENPFLIKGKLQPSGIAVHPVTGEIYLISSVEKLLVVIDTDGAIRSVTELPRQLFLQPEGICFLPGGDMFVSNEGRGGQGNIMRFLYRKQ
ncbi:MAG: SdiA-regulated domain-containing protein [Spirochaetales bacterium]|nr:SdiA-regulated domain-containing protein [Spirochaetales bacterium]